MEVQEASEERPEFGSPSSSSAATPTDPESFAVPSETCHDESLAFAREDVEEAAEEAALREWFPATRADYTPRCGEVKRVVKEDLEDPHRRKHLESFRQSMQEWESYDPSVKNEVEPEVLDAFLSDLLKLRPSTPKDFNAATKTLRKKYKVAPAKSQLVAAYSRLLAGEDLCSEAAPSLAASDPASGGGLERSRALESLMRRKAVRTNSGVLVITVLTAPGRFSCPQDCHYCPNEPGQPRSYLSTEPAVLRANQNGWSPLRQFRDRAETLKKNGHVVDKIEVLVLGGTWSG